MPRNWDQHFADPSRLNWTPSTLLVETVQKLRPGRALDLACGAGRNALYLAQLGWDVIAVDASPVAIHHLRQRAVGFPIDARVIDLERGDFPAPGDEYDLVCDFHYLQRDLFPRLRTAVRPGGTFLGAIFVREPDGNTTHNPAFVLDSGELRAEFTGWKILYYSEANGTARIVARRA